MIISGLYSNVFLFIQMFISNMTESAISLVIPDTLPKRYITIDFLRGFAIWLMVILHVVMIVYDSSWANTTTANARASLLVILFVFMYLGGWCGFFLLLSAIGSMISMQKSLMRGGTSIFNFVLKRVIAGFILLFFAYLSEGFIGYQAATAKILEQDISPTLAAILNYGIPRMYHMETIHAVAWCSIINSIVQGLLSMKNGHQKIVRNMISYGVLTVLVIAFSPIIWDSFGNTRPAVGSSAWDYIKFIFINPIHDQPEPLFPFLAVSFIGSIIGLWLSHPRPSIKFLRWGVLLSVLAEIVGLAGSLAMIILGKQDLLQLVREGWNISVLPAWLFYFLLLTGNQTLSVFLLMRIIEFRGRTHVFAANNKHIRRFGFVPFSIYNFQHITMIPRYLIFFITGIQAYRWGRLNGLYTLVVIATTVLLWQLILTQWEKVNYIGSIEWVMTVIGNAITGRKAPQKTEGTQEVIRKWWQPENLDVKNYFYNANWINLRSETEIQHDQQEDSKLAFWYSLLGFLVFPFSAVAFFIALRIRPLENHGKWNTIAIVSSIIGMIFFIGWFITATFISGIVL